MSRENSAPADTGSSTLTQTGNPSAEARDQAGRAGPSEPVVGVLKLRGDRPARRQKVVWSEGTVDNEGMGKKKSKICCIYHKPKAYDQSSDESSSDESECGHHHGLGKQGGAATRRKAPNVGGSTEQSESSESEGGAGDGRAKPPKKSLIPTHHTDRTERHNEGQKSKANRYDHQPGGSGQTR